MNKHTTVTSFITYDRSTTFYPAQKQRSTSNINKSTQFDADIATKITLVKTAERDNCEEKRKIKTQNEKKEEHHQYRDIREQRLTLSILILPKSQST